MLLCAATDCRRRRPDQDDDADDPTKIDLTLIVSSLPVTHDDDTNRRRRPVLNGTKIAQRSCCAARTACEVSRVFPGRLLLHELSLQHLDAFYASRLKVLSHQIPSAT